MLLVAQAILDVGIEFAGDILDAESVWGCRNGLVGLARLVVGHSLLTSILLTHCGCFLSLSSFRFLFFRTRCRDARSRWGGTVEGG